MSETMLVFRTSSDMAPASSAPNLSKSPNPSSSNPSSSSCHCSKCGGVKSPTTTAATATKSVNQPVTVAKPVNVPPVASPITSEVKGVKNMSNVSNASNGQNGLVNIFSTYEADPVVTTSDKEPPLPYSTKLYLAARICKSVEREAGPATDDTVRKTAALSDDLLIKLAVNNGVQFILNHDGTVHRRPDPWGIVRKDAYGKYDPPEWEGRG